MFNNRFRFFLNLGIFVFILTSVNAGVPSGYYYYAKNKKQAALKTALKTYCSPQKELEYGGGPGFTWEGFFYTDQKADGSVIDMYSNTIRKFSGFSAVDGMHIEHSFPKSWWGAYPNNAYKDLFHLYPADASTNMTKSNLPLGEVSGTPTLDNGVTKVGMNGFGTVYTDNCFEPADEFKGDFARSYFYISTIYEDYYQLWQSPMLNNNTYPVWKPWALDLLLKWHRQDPVSPKELARIEAVYNIQGNRNPYIDYPNLVENIWGNDTANVFPFPIETQAFLLTPRRGLSVDFGVILQNDTRAKLLKIQGVNINSNVNVSLLKNNPAFSLSTKTITVDNALSGIDLGINFTPQAAGLVRDTLIIDGGGLTETLRIPIKALASSDFITLEPTEITAVGGKLQWISDPQALDYQLIVYQGDKQAGDLIISSYIEGTSWNKAIELYNGTGKTIDLSNYSLQKQSDGGGSFVSTLKLAGSLINNKSYVIVHKSAGTDLMSKAQLVTDSLLQFNGNDAIALVRNGVTIDMVGQINGGADMFWGQDVTLKRKSEVTHPFSNFKPSEWTTFPIDSWSMLGNHTMSLITTADAVVKINVLTGKTTSYFVNSLLPQNTYTYKVEATKVGGNSAGINTMQLHTAALDVPILMQATGINANGFTANWEETLFATGYLLNVFQVNGQATITDSEGFDNVGTAGTPLPNNWTGTVSGNYTTTTSSGIATPSVAFKNKGEWLQTKTYTQPVTNFAFMYRFPTVVAASSLIVDGNNNGTWLRIDSIICKNSNKTYPSYTFNVSQNLTAFRFRFNKEGSGNLSVDDVQAKYGSQDTVFILKNKVVSSTQFVVLDLKENSNYFYNVKSTLTNSVSMPSETVGIQTLLNNKLQSNFGSSIKISSMQEQVSISGLQGDEQIQVYNLSGICILQLKSNAPEMKIPLKQNGIYIVHVQNNRYSFSGKVLR
jgi:hypothetical protein